MKTECPHCNTIFAITEEQLRLAEGMVRCGVCDEVFSALVQDDLFVDSAAETGDLVANDNQQELAQQQDSTAGAATRPATAAAPALHDAWREPGQQDDIRAEAAADDEDWQHPQLATPADDVGLFESSGHSVVPDEFRFQGSRTSPLATALWSLGSSLLLVCIVLQFAWIERELLMRSDLLRPWMDRLCERVDCGSIGLRAPERVEMTSRNVYTHPTVEDALMVSLSIVNRARFPQPYPDIRIHFSDVIGNVIASRRFRPHEYLALEADDLRELEPQAPVSFGIEIRDPGERALTYEFEFL